MTLVIGTDEAGYGPNLGPLAVAATVWHVAAAPDVVEETLNAAVADAIPDRLWGDSKAIYRGGAGLPALERGVLTALSLADVSPPADWPSLVAAIGASPDHPPPEQEALGRVRLPRHGQPSDGPLLAATIRRPLADRGVRLLAARCRLVQPAEFNALLDSGLNKSDILSAITLDLAAALASTTTAAEPVVIWCDRHGGRRRYAAQVSRAFDTPLVSPLEETPTRSRYALDGHRWIEFSVGGESRIPVAVASMTAKYLRELAMLAFNTHWAARQPGLAATAGYPVDAGRWRNQAAAAIDAAGISQDAIWRRA
jgi:ribonuclease HII